MISVFSVEKIIKKTNISKTSNLPTSLTLLFSALN